MSAPEARFGTGRERELTIGEVAGGDVVFGGGEEVFGGGEVCARKRTVSTLIGLEKVVLKIL